MKRGRAVTAALLCLVSAATLRAEEAASEWERAFPTRAAPAQVHFRAAYLDGSGRTHDLEVWREADVRLRRRTDDAIDLFVEKSQSGEYVYRLIDHHRNLLLHADRTSLYRLGVFSDWLGLAHVLNVPRGDYRVADAPRQSDASLRGECAWKRLERTTPSPGSTEVCWSTQWGLPLEIGTTDGSDGWKSHFRIEKVGTFTAGPEVFAIAPEGLVEIDADPGGEISD
jgi:hypothetical protein